MVYVACVPLTLSASWEHFIINLAYVTKMVFGTKYKETVKIQVRVGRFLQTTQNRKTSFLPFSLQIHANCRIRRVYFSDRVYSYKELPSEYKLRIVGEGHTVPGVKAAMADTLPAVPSGSDHRGLRDGLTELRIATGLQTTAAGPVYARGIQSMLNSTEKDPLNRWEKEVKKPLTPRSITSPLSLILLLSYSFITVEPPGLFICVLLQHERSLEAKATP